MVMMKIPNPKSIGSQSSATSNKTLEIQCLIGNPKILTHPSRLLQFSCFEKRFKPGGFSLTLSLSLLYSGFRTTRSNSNQKTRKKMTKISLELNSNLGGDLDLAKPGMTNASLLELRRFEATHNSFPPTAILQFSTFF
jgi:hypothetical protein